VGEWTVTAIDETTATPTPAPDPSGSGSGARLLRAAGIASLGAGAIQATAAVEHSHYRAAVIAFVITAAAQLAWGGWALFRAHRVVGLVGAVVNGAAVGGWLLAKVDGIGFVNGLQAPESPGFADSVAAAFGAFAAVAATISLDRALRVAPQVGRWLTRAAAIGTVALVVPGMVVTARQTYTVPVAHDHSADASGTIPPIPYTGKLPVDLSGVPGVSAKDVADAEALVTQVILTLPKFADIPTDQAMGYHSIGDAGTGYEHFVNWNLIDDGRVLDPNYPESLVFQVNFATRAKTLVAAMFMANPGTSLADVPPLGGALVQWHVHDDLCFAGKTNAWKVAGLTLADGTCPSGTFKLGGTAGQVPMVHVWIIPQPCGPFAALEGIGAGEIAPGQVRLCDHVHGSTG
jgi:hypothetical protein